MNISTILFTYNRPKHTQAVLDSLRNSEESPQKLYIFHDGKKSNTNINDWNAVEDIIHSLDWCDVEVVTAENNMGLASSVMSGVTEVFKTSDAVIVLEDDCVVHPNYMQYMVQCLETYKYNRTIHSVSGYSWPIETEVNSESDVYGCGRVSSYGWGTWKDRWENFSLDYNVLRQIYSNKEKSLRLSQWGNDLEKLLIFNLKGWIDSWAIFWALDAIDKQMVCINPYKQLICNIGFDGSGVHCGEQLDKEMYTDSQMVFKLPANVEVSDEVMRGFSNLHNYGCNPGWYKEAGNREKAFVYGCGALLKAKEKSVLELYDVLAIIDNNKKGYYNGKQIIHSRDIDMNDTSSMIIMVKNEESFQQIKEDLAYYKGQLIDGRSL